MTPMFIRTHRGLIVLILYLALLSKKIKVINGCSPHQKINFEGD